MIFLSSSRVYSIDNLRKIIKKKNITKPIKTKKIINEKFVTSEARSLYGFTKLSSENLIQEIFYKTNLKFLINRFGVIAGPWQFGKQIKDLFHYGLLDIFLKKLLILVLEALAIR